MKHFIHVIRENEKYRCFCLCLTPVLLTLAYISLGLFEQPLWRILPALFAVLAVALFFLVIKRKREKVNRLTWLFLAPIALLWIVNLLAGFGIIFLYITAGSLIIAPIASILIIQFLLTVNTKRFLKFGGIILTAACVTSIPILTAMAVFAPNGTGRFDASPSGKNKIYSQSIWASEFDVYPLHAGFIVLTSESKHCSIHEEYEVTWRGDNKVCVKSDRGDQYFEFP